MLVECEFEREGTIGLGSMDAVMAVSLAFPENVADGFSLTPYVAVNSVRRELTLRAPAKTGVEGTVRPISSTKGIGAARPSQCSFDRAVERAARQFLYCDSPGLSKYAETVLKLSKAPTDLGKAPTPRTAVSSFQWSAVATVTEPEINPIYGMLDEVRDGSGPLSDTASKALLGKLVAASISPMQVLGLPSGVLVDMFAKVSDREVVWQWSRKLFADVNAGTFTDLWNKTRVGAFLGFVLLKNLVTAEGEEHKVLADSGADPETTAAILRTMKNYPDGGRSIGRIVARGLGDTESMRQFIAQTFSKDPKFLFDAVLVDIDIQPAQMADYIKSSYESWAAYRRIPDREAAAIYLDLRPTWVQRLKVMFGRQRELGLGGADTSEP
jgi:hypothetical protein